MTDPPETLADLLSAYTAEQCTVIIDAEPKLRAGENVVHVTRVAVRRLRSTIRVFADAYEESESARLEEELVWWASVLGAVRDMDILQAGLTERISGLPPELILGPVESTVFTETAAQRKVASDALKEALDSERYRKLIALVHAWRSDPPCTEAAYAPASEVSSYIRKAKKKVTKRLAAAVQAQQAGEPADELFHRARKAGKRHRYAVEAAVPLLGSKAEKIVSERKDLQDVLGAHQDRIVQSAFLRDLGSRLGVRSGQNGFTYGLLYANVVADGDSILDDLKPFV
jgi:CHAD domain-containing protein